METVCKVLEEHAQSIRSHCKILHDRDETEPHIHIALRLFDARTPKDITNWFPDGQNTFTEALRVRSAFRSYLTHMDKNGCPIDGKHIYDEAEISGDIADTLGSPDESDDALAIINDLLSGVCTYDMIRQYGKDFVYHAGSYYTLKNIIKQEREE